MGHGLLIHAVSRSHTTPHHSRWDSSRRVISSSQRPLPDNIHNRQPFMSPVGFEPPISTGERPQTFVLHRAATETSISVPYGTKFRNSCGKIPPPPIVSKSPNMDMSETCSVPHQINLRFSATRWLSLQEHAENVTKSPSCFTLQLKRSNKLTGRLHLFTDCATNTGKYGDTIHVQRRDSKRRSNY